MSLIGKLHYQVLDPVAYIPMVKLETYELCDIDISAIVCQQQRFLLLLHCSSSRHLLPLLLAWQSNSVRTRKPCSSHPWRGEVSCQIAARALGQNS